MTFLALLRPFVWSGPLGSFADVVALGGTLVLILMVVALGGIAYKGLKGDLQWPEESDETESDDEIRRGQTDEEWKYY